MSAERRKTRASYRRRALGAGLACAALAAACAAMALSQPPSPKPLAWAAEPGFFPAVGAAAATCAALLAAALNLVMRRAHGDRNAGDDAVGDPEAHDEH